MKKINYKKKISGGYQNDLDTPLLLDAIKINSCKSYLKICR